jgi:hypothetical protein
MYFERGLEDQKQIATDKLSLKTLSFRVTAIVDSTVGVVGDLHGIVGKAMPE